jgi:lysozyme family protein
MATYPWLTFSSQTAARQRDINLLAIREGRCPPLLEDGKLGPTTCGYAAHYAGMDPLVAEIRSSCKSTGTVNVDACLQLPWGVKSKETLTLQVALNAALVPQGFCKLVEDGVLGPNTCAAAKAVLGDKSNAMGCRQYGTLSNCAAAADTSQALAPAYVPPAAPPASTYAPTPAPAADQATPIVQEPVVTVSNPAPLAPPTPGMPATQAAMPRPAASGMTPGKWAILGAGVAAVGFGTYFLMKKVKR